jgi:hypothetical protein
MLTKTEKKDALQSFIDARNHLIRVMELDGKSIDEMLQTINTSLYDIGPIIVENRRKAREGMSMKLNEKQKQIAWGAWVDHYDENSNAIGVYAAVAAVLEAQRFKDSPKALSFHDWWTSQGRFIDPDTEDVPWFDKREALAEYAWDAAMRQSEEMCS